MGIGGFPMTGMSSSDGGDGVDTLKQILENPNYFKDGIAALEKAQAAADASIALVGKAKDIENLRKKAELDREAAAAELQKATKDAAAIIEKANQDASSKISSANARVAEVDAYVSGATAEGDLAKAEASKVKGETKAIISAAKAEADAMRADAARALSDATTARTDAALALADASAAKEKFENKLKKLQAATSDD